MHVLHFLPKLAFFSKHFIRNFQLGLRREELRLDGGLGKLLRQWLIPHFSMNKLAYGGLNLFTDLQVSISLAWLGLGRVLKIFKFILLRFKLLLSQHQITR